MWQAVKLKNKEIIEETDWLVGSSLTDKDEHGEIAIREADRRNASKLGKPDETKKKMARSIVSGHPYGYWVVRWVEPVDNEFGPISP